VELIFTIAPIEYIENGEKYDVDPKEVRQETNNGLSTGTMTFDLG